MRQLAVKLVALTLGQAFALVAEAEGSEARDVTVHITERGSCEVAGTSLPCDSVGSRLLALCPGARCQVILDPDVRSNYQPAAAALKSLQEAKFSKILFAARSRRK